MRLRSVIATGMLAGFAAVGNVAAQSYPAKPVRMIISCPPGCLPDILGRAINQQLSPTLGQPVVVDNIAGANGNIALERGIKAAPDGYTISMVSNVAMSLNPFAYAKLPFDPQEMVPVVNLGNLDQAIAVHASVPVRNVRELVDLAKAKPGAVTWASLGAGSTSHLYLEWLSAHTGARFLHVPYKGSPQASSAVLSGEAMVLALTPGLFAPHVKAGKVRVIGVVSGEKRSIVLPDVPTLGEQGFDLDFRNWFALFFPKGTPAEPVRRWNSEVNKVLSDKAFTGKVFLSNSVTPAGGTPQELAALAKASRATGEELAKIAKLKFD